MKKIILFLLLIITAASLYSCRSDKIYAPAMIVFKAPENAAVTVRDIRVKGFTLDWTMLLDNNYEYAIAASHNGHIEDYETARENGKIVLDFRR